MLHRHLDLPAATRNLRELRRPSLHLPPIAAPAPNQDQARLGLRQSAPPPRLAPLGAVLFRELIAAETVDVLKRNGIRSILLKGPAIARWLYHSSTARVYGDSDLLVSPDDFDASQETIAALGYRPCGEQLPGDRPWSARYFVRPGDGTAVDLHLTLTGIETSPSRAWTILSERTEVMRLRGVDIEVLNEPARALHIALHAADHGAHTPRPLEDLTAALAALHEDLWRQAASLASQLEATAAFAAGLRLHPEGAQLAAHLGLPPNRSVEVALRASPSAGHALGLKWLLETPGLRAKAALLRHKLAPPPAYMRTCSALASKGTGGLALAYLWRPLHLAASAPPALAALRRARRATLHHNSKCPN